MRWEGQDVEREREGRLPGLGEQSVTRTFDAPEAMGVRFHEVEARSALNRVPGRTLPFNWTVNPYRGCSHACTYCMSGDALILLGDGRTRPLEDVREGDEIYGTEGPVGDRRFVKTRVVAHWGTQKEAHRLLLADGTELVASGDHRFLTDDGWRYVAGSAGGRPRLDRGTLLLGTQGYHGSIEGRRVEPDGCHKVVEIEPFSRRIPMFDITTGTGDFIANGVISHNCFARPTHRYLDLSAREDFEREIVVKVNVPERLRAELRRPSWTGEMIALGTNTDPYQWVEGRYGLTRAIWEVLIEARNPASVLTKSPLLVRDIDLFKQLNEVAGFQASLSIPTLDEQAWRATEPRTPHPRKRIEAVAELSRAGVPVGVLIAPLMPGINDSPAQVERILELCAEAGANSVGGLGLHLKGEVREIFLDWLRSQRPDLVARYEELYADGAFLPRGERDRIGRMLASGRRRFRIPSSHFRESGGVAGRQADAKPKRSAASRQPRLF